MPRAGHDCSGQGFDHRGTGQAVTLRSESRSGGATGPLDARRTGETRSAARSIDDADLPVLATTEKVEGCGRLMPRCAAAATSAPVGRYARRR